MLNYLEIFIITTIYSIIIGGIWQLIKLRFSAQKKDADSFVVCLTKGIDEGLIQSLKDVDDIRIGHFLDRRIKYYPTAILIRRAKLEISKNATTNSKTSIPSLDIINRIIEELEVSEKEAKELKPFAEVPSSERGALELLREITKDKNNPVIQEKLVELAKAITSRESVINKLSDEKGTSLKWAKAGVFGTVFFGLLSIIIAYINL